MEFAYLDESGDRGAKGSKYLILTLMCTSKRKEITKIIANAKKRLLENNKCRRWLNRQGGEVKFYGFPNKNLLKRTLTKLSKLNIKIYFIALKKNNKKVEDHDKGIILTPLFHHIFKNSKKIVPYKIIADLNFFNKQKINRFSLERYFVEPIKLKKEDGKTMDVERAHATFISINEETYDKLKDDPSRFVLTIEHQNSRLNEVLQALDLISGCIFAFYENDNPECIEKLRKGKLTMNGIVMERDKK